MKTINFHQFIHIERGPVNSALIDFLKGEIYQTTNKVIDKISSNDHKSIVEFVSCANREELLIEINKSKWIPKLNIEPIELDKSNSVELEIDDGVDLDIVNRINENIELIKLIYYGENPIINHKNINMVKKKKNLYDCLNLIKENRLSYKINDNYYRFNKKYNSCWGKKMAIFGDGSVGPCIFSQIRVGNIKKENMHIILNRLKYYWTINKDKIKKCKDCEFRYACFDCREISRRKKDLFNSNPFCSYDPIKGEWIEA